MPKGRGASKKNGYRHVSKEERLAIAAERVVRARVALALAELDEDKLSRLKEGDGDAEFARELGAVGDRKDAARRTIEASGKEADRLRGKPLSRSGKAKTTKLVNERVETEVTQLVRQWEGSRFEHELNLAELDEDDDAREAQEQAIRIYDAAIAAAEDRLK